MRSERRGPLGARRLARLVVRLASFGAPYGERGPMVREWHAEIEREFATGGGGWHTVREAMGAFADARATRRIEREIRGARTMGDVMAGWRSEAAHAVRALMRAPGFTAIAVLTLGIGIGGSTGIYALLDRVVLDPLPYPQAERLVRLENQVPGVGPDAVWSMSTAQWAYFTDNATTLDDVGLYRGGGGNLITELGPERARSVHVTASMVGLLGLEAELGRLITPADDEPGATPVTMLAEGFWTRAFGADPGVIGTTVSLDGVSLEVIGVVRAGTELPGWPTGSPPDLWLPLRINRGGSFSNSHVFPGIARLASGETPATAEAEIERLTARLPEAFPRAYAQAFFDQYGFRTVVTPLKQSVVGDMARNLWMIFGGVGLVLLIACANVANIFLVRVESKRREIAVRTALGADRPAIARYLLIESLALAAAGGVLALAVAWQVVPALSALAPADLPRIQGATLDPESALFCLLLSAGVGLVIGTFPLVGRATADATLGEGGRSSTTGRRGQRMRSAIVASQLALAVTLVVGAGLLVQSVRTLYDSDSGVETEGVVAVDLHLDPARHADDVALWTAYQQILERVRALPGVTAAGMSEEIPVEGGFGCTVQGFEDEAVFERIEAAGMTTCAGQTRVAPGFFEALSIPLVAGRYPEAGDNDDPTRAATVVTRAFAERFWPGEDAVGKGVAPSGRTVGPFYQVVGVVEDVAKRATEGRPPLSEPAIGIFYPVVHDPRTPGNWGWWWAGSMTLVVRSAGADPTSIVPAIRRVVAEVDPQIPIANARAMDDVVAEAMAGISFVSLLLGIAAAAALALAGVGLYGVIAYVVSQRTREIGMRLAIGARPGEVVRGVVGSTLRLVAAGMVIGIPLALAVSRLGEGLLVGVEPTSPLAYVGAVTLITVIALGASWVPARRASRIDPVAALRSE